MNTTASSKAPSRVLEDLSQLFGSWDLLVAWTSREFRVRYSQSVLGSAWAILQPLALMAIFSLVFSVFVTVPTEGIPYPVFAYSGLLPWLWFSNSISTAIPSLVNNSNLVSKVNLSREVLPLSSILVGLIDLLIALPIFALLALIYKTPIAITALWVPLLLLIQFMLTYGLSLVGAAMNVFYRDIRFIIPLALQILMYISPIIYPVSAIPEQYRFIYLLNPLAVLIDSYRRVILQGLSPDWVHLGIAAAISFAVMILGHMYFKRAERSFADFI